MIENFFPRIVWKEGKRNSVLKILIWKCDNILILRNPKQVLLVIYNRERKFLIDRSPGSERFFFSTDKVYLLSLKNIAGDKLTINYATGCWEQWSTIEISGGVLCKFVSRKWEKTGTGKRVNCGLIGRINREGFSVIPPYFKYSAVSSFFFFCFGGVVPVCYGFPRLRVSVRCCPSGEITIECVRLVFPRGGNVVISFFHFFFSKSVLSHGGELFSNPIEFI